MVKRESIMTSLQHTVWSEHTPHLYSSLEESALGRGRTCLEAKHLILADCNSLCRVHLSCSRSRWKQGFDFPVGLGASRTELGSQGRPSLKLLDRSHFIPILSRRGCFYHMEGTSSCLKTAVGCFDWTASFRKFDNCTQPISPLHSTPLHHSFSYRRLVDELLPFIHLYLLALAMYVLGNLQRF